jgi:DNA-binding response OmpR family regulator
MRVLIIEDEEALAAAIARGLRRQGMAVDVAHDGRSGLDKACLNDYDVVVLDRNLPEMHGDEVCRQLAGPSSTARILMLTAASGLRDRVAGLDLGADDYLGKPFAFDELAARVRHSDIELDSASRRARRGDRDLELTNKEFGVLEVLLAAAGVVVSSEELLEKVWDENTDPFSNVVRVTMMTLRRKLGESQPIQTVPGVGYRL